MLVEQKGLRYRLNPPVTINLKKESPVIVSFLWSKENLAETTVNFTNTAELVDMMIIYCRDANIVTITVWKVTKIGRNCHMSNVIDDDKQLQ